MDCWIGLELGVDSVGQSYLFHSVDCGIGWIAGYRAIAWCG
jgi:hypothetical protein